MSKIVGDKNAIDRLCNSPAGDKSVYVNLDAIRDLPDEFEAVITELKIDIKSDFSDVGNETYMPKPELMYRIAEARGISGGEQSIVEDIIQEIDINPLLCKPIDAQPQFQRRIVGKKVIKYSTVLEEDGTLRRSSPCTSTYNVWERCLELWSKEELYTDGYTKQAKYPPKYDTPYKRKAHFDGEMKFASAKAETKAHLKTIRELAGLMTGYRKDDLAKGVMVFAKIRRSSMALKTETAARLAALSRGIEPGRTATAMLFGSTDLQPEPAHEAHDVQPDFEPVPQQAPAKTKRDEFIAVLGMYIESFIVPANIMDPAGKVLEWLKKTPTAESDKQYWAKAIGILKAIEQDLPESAKITHGIE
jgi:hypothetical protein